MRAAADGYTLLFISSQLVQRDALRQTQFRFRSRHRAGRKRHPWPLSWSCFRRFPAKSVPELVALAKADPGKITMASGGIGSTQHVCGELFKMMAGVDMLHVPYRGGAPALTDLLAGQVQVMFDTLPTSIEHIRAGRLRARR